MPDASELDTLKAKLARRQSIPAYQANCEELRQRIAELEKAQGE